MSFYIKAVDSHEFRQNKELVGGGRTTTKNSFVRVLLLKHAAPDCRGSRRKRICRDRTKRIQEPTDRCRKQSYLQSEKKDLI